MGGISQLGSSLRMTNTHIERCSKQNPKNMSPVDINSLTKTAKDSGEKLAKARSGSRPAGVDPKMLDAMVANINKIQQKTPEKPPKKLSQMLEALDYLKGKLEKYHARAPTGKSKLDKRVSQEQEAKQIHKTLTIQLNTTRKELSHLKQAVEHHDKISETELEHLETMLNKTEGVVVKEIALFKALSLPNMPGSTQNVIGKILEDIKFLHHTIGAQVKAGTALVQARSFRLTLRKIKDRLRALQKLNKSRGEMAAQVEQDTQR